MPYRIDSRWNLNWSFQLDDFDCWHTISCSFHSLCETEAHWCWHLFWLSSHETSSPLFCYICFHSSRFSRSVRSPQSSCALSPKTSNYSSHRKRETDGVIGAGTNSRKKKNFYHLLICWLPLLISRLRLWEREAKFRSKDEQQQKEVKIYSKKLDIILDFYFRIHRPCQRRIAFSQLLSSLYFS